MRQTSFPEEILILITDHHSCALYERVVSLARAARSVLNPLVCDASFFDFQPVSSVAQMVPVQRKTKKTTVNFNEMTVSGATLAVACCIHFVFQ